MSIKAKRGRPTGRVTILRRRHQNYALTLRDVEKALTAAERKVAELQGLYQTMRDMTAEAERALLAELST